MDTNDNKYGLTYPQKNIWLVDKFYGNTAINVIAGIIEINKEFDINTCKKVLNLMVKQNDGLRLVISEENGEPVQRVSEYQKFDIDVFDMTGKTKKDMKELDDRLTSKPFDVLNNNLYYFAIVKESDEKGYMIIKVHHLVSDAWTFGRIATTIGNLYDNINKIDFVEEEIPSYIEYIKTEKEYLDSEKFAKDKLFWETYLDGVTESVGLKEDLNSSDMHAKRYSLKLNGKLNSKINEYCKENRVSPYTVFMNALAIYLHRTKGKNDFVVGTPVLNRSNFREKQIMGMFVSTMPIRFKIDEKQTFLEMCKATATETMSLFRHQKYPYSLVLEDFRKKSGLRDNIYKTMISYQNARAEYSEENKYSSRWNFSGEVEDDFAIHIMDMDGSGTLETHFDYRISVFEDIEIKYIASRIFAIIEDGINNNKTIETIEIMTKEEKDKILYEFNDTDMEYPKDKTIIELFEEQVEKTPDNIALVFEDRQMTYREFNEKANQLAHYLIEEKGIKSNDIVGILQNRSLEMMISIFGILKSGAAYLPIDISYPEDRIKYIVNNSKAKIILKEEDVLDVINVNGNINNVGTYGVDNLAYIIYTSGTTGEPKGVKIKHSSVTNLLFAMDKVKRISQCKVNISISRYTFDMFVIETILPLTLGLKCVLANENESIMPDKIAELINNNMAEVLFITPTKLNMLLNEPEYINKLKYLKKITIAGENLKESLINIVMKNFNADIFNGYGPTEATVCTTIKVIKDSEKITIGKCIGNIKGYILDTYSRLLPIGVPGQLCIGGDCLFDGYLNDDERTNSKIILFIDKRLYKSGDVCILNYDLELEYKGREDNQIKINGLRIELDEIEKNISNIDNIKDCSVCVKENNLYAFIKEINKIEDNEIISILSKKLPSYMIPKKYIRIDAFPINSSGKIDKVKLLDLNSNVKRERKNAITYTKIQKKILSIIQKQLMDSFEIQPDENLIGQGIDSLGIINITVGINKEFSIDIEPNEIFNSPTLYDIEQIIISKEKKDKNIAGKLDYEKQELSSNQKKIFAAYTKDPNNIVYNMPCEIVLSKDIDITKFIDSVEEVLNRNEVFKSNIDIKDSSLYLIVNKDRNIEIKMQDISQKEYRNIKEKFIRPFDLLVDKLVRVEIYSTESNIYMLFDTHHIIFDGISMVNLIEQIKNKFEGNINENSYINNSYYQYLNDIKNLKNKEKYIEAENYFKEMLDGEISTTIIEQDNNNDSKGFLGDKIENKISVKFNKEIQDFCSINNITANALFLSAVKIVLSKYTYSDEVLLGLAFSGRNKYEYQNTIGLFVNTMPYRNSINWDMKIKEYIRETGRDIINLATYDFYDINDLLLKENIKNINAKSNIYNIVYTYQNFGYPNINLQNNKLILNELSTNTSKFDITIEVMPKEDTHYINIEYSKDKYIEETILRLSDNIENVLKYMVNNSSYKLKDIDMISKKEKMLIIDEFNDTYGEYDRTLTIHEIFQKQLDQNRKKIAIVDKLGKITYEELELESNKVAHMLRQEGVKPNTMVSVIMDKSINYMISIIGILKAGAAYLPVDIDFPLKRQKYMIEAANSKIILTTRNHDIKDINDIKKIYKEDSFSYKSTTIGNVNNTSDLAYIMYTSGTTGNPKGVMVTHKNVIRLIQNTNYIKPMEGDRVLQTGAVGFDATTFEYWQALFNGATLYLIPKEVLLDMPLLRKYIDDNNINVMFLTSQLFKSIVQYNPKTFQNVRVLLTGGEILSAKHVSAVLDSCPNVMLYNVYGPTENTTFSTYYKINNKFTQNNIPIGKPISNTTCYIIDKCNKLCGIGIPGELCTGGEGVAKGYFNNLDLTKEKFIKNPFVKNDTIYKSGDLVKWSCDGNINFLGRIDKQIKIRGFRIELDEIKVKIEQYGGVIDSFVNAVNVNNTYVINAYIKVDRDVKVQDIRNFLKEELPLYMIPKNIVIVDKIEMNINGKVDLSKLPEIVNNEETQTFVLPKNELENKIFNAWKQVLGHENFGVTDDFFEIGGDSLLASEVVIVLLSYDIKIAYADLFKNTTISALANNIKNDKMIEVNRDISDYDYSKYSRILDSNSKTNYTIKNNNIKNVFITGGTGFLGAHIIDSFMKNLDGKIYCLIRKKGFESAEERLKYKLRFFFGRKYDEFINERIIVIEGDITNENLFSKQDADIIKEIDAVIHVAAEVKHFGKVENFENTNITGTKNVVDFCKNYNKKLYHISTLSVSGNVSEGSNDEQEISEITDFSENNYYIGQKITNEYVKSKFYAEGYVLDNILDGLDAKIIRVGNLTGRLSDGKFQPNVEENAFSNRIRSILYLRMVPEKIKKLYAEFTPIDVCSNMILGIIKNDCNLNIYHLFNHNHVLIDEMIKILNNIGFYIEMVDDLKFATKIKELAKVDHTSVALKGIIGDLNKNTELNYISNIIVKSDITKEYLSKLGMSWPKIDERYVNRYIKYLLSIGYIDKKEIGYGGKK